VPVNQPVIITLSSKDVIHSFKVIAMRVTQDAIPGVPIPLHFTPTKVGVYQINCAQLCGVGHYGMANGRLYVDTEDDYKKWVASKTKPGGSAPQSFE
jgi:cytochrome c oxidase subunit 2